MSSGLDIDTGMMAGRRQHNIHHGVMNYSPRHYETVRYEIIHHDTTQPTNLQPMKSRRVDACRISRQHAGSVIGDSQRNQPR
jgi:hypothetical protein